MLRALRFLTLAGLVLQAGWSQQSYPFFSPSPGPPLVVTATAISPFGQSSYCYWVVAIYPIGKSTPSVPSCVPNAIETSSVLISWSAASGASTYDVLRTTTPILPNVTSSIAVATAVSATTQTDSFGALSSYTLNSTPSASATLFLDNVDFSTPQLRAVITGVGGINAFNLASAGASVTYNGQTVALGGSGNVNSGAAAHSVSLNEGNGAAITGAAIGTAGRLLIDQGAAADPSFNALSGAATITSAGVMSLTNPLTVPGPNGQIQLTEGSAPTCNAGSDWLWADAAAHNFKLCVNGGSNLTLAPSATTDTTNASNITSGTLPTGQLPSSWSPSQGTITASTPFINHTATWNNAGVQFTDIFTNVTKTAAQNSSRLIDLEVGSVSQFNVNAVGTATLPGPIVATTSGFFASTGTCYQWNVIGSGRSCIDSAVDGIINFRNNAQTGLTRINLGGTTSSFPAWSPVSQTNPIMQLQDAAAGTTAVLSAPAHIAQGTRPTITGCGTISSQVGGATAGTFVTNAVSCTPVLTSLPTVPNGYFCAIVDRTSATGTMIGSISSTATSATFPTFTTVASDVLAFNCGIAF